MKPKSKPVATITSNDVATTSSSPIIESANKKKNKKKKGAAMKEASENDKPQEKTTELPAIQFLKSRNAPSKKVSAAGSSPSQPKSIKRKFDNGNAATKSASQQNAKKMKFNNKNDKKTQSKSNDLSENRLKAFGINPKKFKNKIKYGGGKSQQSGQRSNGDSKKNFNKKKSNS